MSKNKYNRTTFGFEVTPDELEELKRRSNNVKTTRKDITRKEVYLAGLMALEDDNSFHGALRKRKSLIKQRENLLIKLTDINRHIEGVNTQILANYPLKAKKEKINKDTNVYKILIKDENDNELKF